MKMSLSISIQKLAVAFAITIAVLTMSTAILSIGLAPTGFSIDFALHPPQASTAMADSEIDSLRESRHHPFWQELDVIFNPTDSPVINHIVSRSQSDLR
ncbi:MAG: hypothetical protein O7E52_02680 [Candidatus Poribacteria bacterium]|nr:hypothetical protein [Candidatus Poribacteria bacterium]